MGVKNPSDLKNLGFTGDGFVCEDINECELETHNCTSNEYCHNDPGDYTCKCRAGYQMKSQGLNRLVHSSESYYMNHII